MEKKTIGKFIAALRKANGMTQRELSERLFVSDKTVSRWECDECTPEISLLPSIAEIFSITVDELVRGERNRAGAEDAEAEERQRGKRDKQFKRMLDKNNKKYKNLTLISIGVTLFGLLAAMVANLAFSKGLIAFCLSAAFCAASEICQICFSINARIPEEEEEFYANEIRAANTGVTRTAVRITFLNLATLAFSLPLVTLINGVNYGMSFASWLLYGALYAVIALAIAYVAYEFFARKILCEKKLMFLSDEQKDREEKNKKLLKRVLAIASLVTLALGVGIVVLNSLDKSALAEKRTFDDCADFKAFVESDFDRWAAEGDGYMDGDGSWTVEIPVDPDGGKEYDRIINSKGEIVCEYYYRPSLYHEILVSESEEGEISVTVITQKAYRKVVYTVQQIESALYALISADFVLAALVYAIGINRRKQEKNP